MVLVILLTLFLEKYVIDVKSKNFVVKD